MGCDLKGPLSGGETVKNHVTNQPFHGDTTEYEVDNWIMLKPSIDNKDVDGLCLKIGRRDNFLGKRWAGMWYPGYPMAICGYLWANQYFNSQ